VYSSQQNLSGQPPVLRALALGLLAGTVAPSLNGSGEGASAEPHPQGEGSTENETELGQALRGKCHELATLVLLAHDPEEAAAHVLAYLPHHIATVFALVFRRFRAPSLCELKGGAVPQKDRWHVVDPA
jgi:hypothetical protein